MKQLKHHIWIGMVALLTLVGCDVHEFPDVYVPFEMHLDFTSMTAEMPIYEEVYYTRDGAVAKEGADDAYDVRYIINAHRIDDKRNESRIPDATFVFTKPDLSDLNYTARFDLLEGTYKFRIWADYVDAGTTADKYYDTHDFSEIVLADRDNHPGSNDYRDAFRGYGTATVSNPVYNPDSTLKYEVNNEVTIDMQRPMGKFKFVSTNADIFLNRVVQMMKEKGGQEPSPEVEANANLTYEQLLRSIDLDDFYVVFRYHAFMPCAFNMFIDKPADSWTGVSFASRMYSEDNMELTLGYDYIFVNGAETTITLSLEVYNKEGELMSSTNPIKVPIVRNKLTVVKGDFLTSKASGGVAINPSFDGEDYNVEIKF